MVGESVTDGVVDVVSASVGVLSLVEAAVLLALAVGDVGPLVGGDAGVESLVLAGADVPVVAPGPGFGICPITGAQRVLAATSDSAIDFIDFSSFVPAVLPPEPDDPDEPEFFVLDPDDFDEPVVRDDVDPVEELLLDDVLEFLFCSEVALRSME